MKKSLLAVAIAATLIAACAPEKEAKAEGVTVYGSAEQAITSQGGVADMAAGDNYIGFRAAESFGEGKGSAFAKIELGVDPEGTNTMSTRESYVGLDMGDVTVTAGKQKNLEKVMLNGLVDIMEGNGSTTANQARVNNAVAVVAEVAGVTVGASSITEGTSGEDKIDSYELGAKTTFGAVTGVVMYNKNQTTNVDQISYGVGADVAGISVGATVEPDADTNTFAASTDFGANTIRGSYQDVDGGNNTTAVEVAHNFSKTTSAYINYSETENSDAATMVGMRIVF
jgi:hypothetical protein